MSVSSGRGPGPRTRAFVDWTLRHARAIWIVALVLAVPATWRTATLYMHLKSDLEELLPRNAESVKAIDELRARMPGLQYLGVLVDTGDASKLPQGEKLLDDLAARVRAYPKELARSVRLGTKEEHAFLESHAPLYVDLEDLKTIRARIEARRDYDVEKETGNLLDESEPPPPLDFADLEKKYEAKLGANKDAEADRFSSNKLHLTMMLIEVGGFETGSKHSKELLSRVQADVRAMGGTDAYAPGMRLGYSGDVAISVEEMEALVADLSLSSIIVLVAVVAVIVLYFRWSKSIFVLVPPLLLATVYAFALASLPPFGVTELNSNTAFLGSIIVGNGINFGILLLARYVEERRAGSDVRESLVTGVWSARSGTLAAALGAGVSYASLGITQFRGFRQFGIIGGIGMLMSWAVAFLCMPPLVAWLDRKRGGGPKAQRDEAKLMTWVGRFVVRWRVPVVAVGAVLTFVAGAKVRTFNLGMLEYDFSKLRRADTWLVGEGYWGGKMDELLGTYITPLVVLTDSTDEARALATRLHTAAESPPLDGMISSIRTLDDVLPLDQQAKIAEANLIREDLTPKIRSLIPPAKKEQLDRLLGADDKPQTTITLADLPSTFTTALVERDGSAGRAVLVYPKPSKALWQGPPLAAFVRALRDTAVGGGAKPARVAGQLPLSADIVDSIGRDGPLASGVAFGGVVLVVLLLFRRQTTTIYVIGSLVVGVLWLAAATMFLGVKLNFANFIAFPITFGIGVDYSVNVMARYAQDAKKDVLATLRATGSAVALCSLTTIIGYSSLLVAENRALFLFGLVAVLGEVCCLATAVTLLPAVLEIVQRRRTP